MGTHVRVHVHSAEVQRRDLQVLYKVDTLICIVRVPAAAVPALIETFIAKGNDMVRIDALDELAHRPRPLRDRRRCARSSTTIRPTAPRLIRKLPPHDRGLVLVPPNKVTNIVLEARNAVRVRVEPAVVAAPKCRHVRVHTAIIRPVVRQRDDQLDPARACRTDDAVEPADAVSARVEGLLAVLEELVVRAPFLRGRTVVEAPGAHKRESSGLHIREGRVDVGVGVLR